MWLQTRAVSHVGRKIAEKPNQSAESNVKSWKSWIKWLAKLLTS